MKVVKFAPAFSRQSQTFIYDLACGLHRELADFRVLTLERENPEQRPFTAVDVLHDVTETPSKTNLSLWKRLIGKTSEELRTARFVEYFKARRPDVVHAHFGPAAAMLIDACEATETPLIVSLRGYDASRLVQERRWRRIYADLFPRCQTIAVVTSEMRSRIEPFAADVPIVAVHAGKDASQYPYGPPVALARQFLCIGRLVEKKAHGDAIRAIGHARKMGADVTLDIIGEGEQRQSLEALIRAEGLADAVRLRGRLPHGRVKQMLRASDAFVLASRTASNGDKEGVPNVLKEAQLTGLPVVSTRHAGIPDVVPEANHRWLVDEGDWRTLGKRIYELSRCDLDELEAMTKRARQHVEHHFSHDREVSRYIELYTRAVQDAR